MKSILSCSGIALFGVFQVVGLIVFAKLIFYWTGWNSATAFVDSIIYAKGYGGFIFRCIVYSWAALIAFSIFFDDDFSMVIIESRATLFWLYLVVGSITVDFIVLLVIKTYLQGFLASWVFDAICQSYFTGAALITLMSIKSKTPKPISNTDLFKSGFKVVTKLKDDNIKGSSNETFVEKTTLDTYSYIIGVSIFIMFFLHIYLFMPI